MSEARTRPVLQKTEDGPLPAVCGSVGPEGAPLARKWLGSLHFKFGPHSSPSRVQTAEPHPKFPKLSLLHPKVLSVPGIRGSQG